MPGIRDSAGLFLQVLTDVPVVGVPIEIDVYDGAAPATMLATMEGAVEAGWNDPLGDIGAGSFKLYVDDPKATPANMANGNLIKCKIGGIYRFAFWIEGPKRTVASERGRIGDHYLIAGRDRQAYLERSIVYPAGWPSSVTTNTRTFTNASPGLIMKTFIDEAVARGGLPFMTYDFSAALDSQSQPWVQSLTLDITAGTSLLDVWRQLLGLGTEGGMTVDLKLQMFVSRAVHLESTVIFREGPHLRSSVDQITGNQALKTEILVEGSGGKFLQISNVAREADAHVGRREVHVPFNSSSDPTTLQRVGEASLAAFQNEAQAISVAVAHGLTAGQFEPYFDYGVGDWITLDVLGVYPLSAERIAQITIKQIPGGGFDVDLDLNSVAVEYLLQLKRMINALGGGSGSASSAGSVSTVIGGGSGQSGSSGKVAATLGDVTGYLYDKLSVIGLAKTLAGTAPNQTVQLSSVAANLDSLTDVDTTTIAPTNGQALIFDSVSGLWKPGAISGGGASWQDRIIARGSSANAADDEFNDGALAAAWVDVGPAHSQVWTEAADVLSLLHASNSDTGGQGQFHAKLRAVPIGFASGSVIEAGVRSLGSSGGYPMVGLMMTNGTAYTNATDYVYGATYSSGSTTQGRRNVTIRRGKFVTAESAATDPDLDATGEIGLHLRLKWAAANTWELAISPDAVSWLTVASGITYTMTPTHIGLAFTSWGIVGNRVATWDYFRVR